MKIKVKYLEFGCVPGTISFEDIGQQGESYPAKFPLEFNQISIDSEELLKTEKIILYIKQNRINRNIQPEWGSGNQIFTINSSNPVITYMRQNDYESGLYPYTIRSKKNHSPIFKSTIDALTYLSLLCIKNKWRLIYRPHPIIEMLNSEKVYDEKIICETATYVNIHELIDYSDVIVTILSQTAYEALFRDKPVVILGYLPLHCSGAIYEIQKKKDVEKQINKAIESGYTVVQKTNFCKHITRMLKYSLYDDNSTRTLRYGKKMDDMQTK